MQRFRFLAVIVATNLACGSFLAHADDTPAQAAARAALQQQMSQMDNGEGGTNSTTMTPPAEPAPSTPPMTAPTPQFSTNVPISVPPESETPPAKMPPVNVPAAPAAPAPMQSQTNAGAMNMTVPPSVLNTNETEQYPVNPSMAPLPPAQSEGASTPLPAATTSPTLVAPQPNPAAQPLPASSATSPGDIQNEQGTTNGVPAYSPMTAPPLPFSSEKQSELQNLLSQYMSNQITPTQYQEQRAKILAEP